MKRKKIQLYPYWLVVPAAVFILVFYILPIGLGLVLSFTNWNIKYPTMEFVGLENYINIWKDPEFQKALSNTLCFAAVILVARNVLALLLALALTQKLKTANILRSIFYLPSVLSYVVVGVIFKALFQMKGLVNQFLGLFTGKPVLIDWIGNANLALPTVMLLDLWVWTGFHMMLYIAGIQSISKEYYEAAIVDGASAWQRFRKITLPLLASTIRMSVVLTLCGGLRVFDSVKVLTNGGPGWASTTINIEVYKLFSQGFYARATAVELMLSIILFIGIGIIQRLFRKGEENVS
ncbi:carbohydrate ABC transporter permease [Blautia sp. 1033sp1_1033st1_G9_1033SCRN_220408]|uniref:carbohydrate ABC transporter permease n=1 Tax=Blautia sp. 1033sp1_1033st1_G9_1033SCRN_220408 TaxID=3144490 RepID=UPI0034A4033D